MVKNKVKSPKFRELRKQAEQILGEKDFEEIEREDIHGLIEDLHIHQIELETQNEQLRKIQKGLQETRDKYHSLFEFAPVGYFTIDENGIIQEVNLTGTELLDIQRKYLTKRGFSRYVAKDYQDVFYSYRKQLLRTKQRQTCELKMVKQDGTEFYAKLDSIVVQDSEKGLSHFQIAITDITERKQMEEEIHKLDKLKSVGVLAGGIAHDFNNLLTTILGNIQLAKMSSTNLSVTERLEASEKASLQARDLTKRLLTFSKGGAPVKKDASISKLLEETTEFLLSSSNVRCELSIDDEIWSAEIDTGQISQVIQNLVTNADAAMPNGGIIRVKAENLAINGSESLPLKEGRYIKISVSDEGIGIEDKILPKIFDPYFSTKDMCSDKGTGLGLAICHSIIEKHGGYITVESRVDVGTTFYLYLPTSTNQESEESSKEETEFSNGKILVMDDEEIVREVAKELLSYLDYDVELASDGEEAIGIYKQHYESGIRFDAVILDLTARGKMGGKEALERLIEIDPEVKAIVSSGYYNNPIMSNYKQYGFTEAIAKPYKIKQLSDLLRKVTIYL